MLLWGREGKRSSSMAACYVPFNNRNLDISIYVFRPNVVIVDRLLDGLKHFSAATESLGCVQSSIFASIHGNMMIWYGAWTKKSSENKASLNTTLKSMLTTTTSTMAALIEQSFFDPYAGKSRDGTSAAKFSTGDIISVSAIEPYPTLPTEPTTLDLAQLCLDNFKSRFAEIEGVGSGACLKSQGGQRIACLYMWKSLELCYAWILSTDYRKAMVPSIDDRRVSLEVKFDVFRVVYVSSDDGAGSYPRYRSPRRMLEREEERKEGHVMQN